MLSRRAWVILGLAAASVGGLLFLNGRRPAPLVRVSKVARADLKSMIASNGKVEPVAPQTLRARFDGFVSRVVAVEGKSVRSGELLLTLDDTQVRAQLEQARAQLAAEEAELRAAEAGGRADELARLAGDLRATEAQRDLLQRQYDALVKLLAERAATQDELERSRTALERAKADVDHLRKSREQFEQQVGLTASALLRPGWQAQVKIPGEGELARVVAPATACCFHPGVTTCAHRGPAGGPGGLAHVRAGFVMSPSCGWRRRRWRLPGTPYRSAPDRPHGDGSATGGGSGLPQRRRIAVLISNDRMELKPHHGEYTHQLSERRGVPAPRAAVRW
jgi:hypothetical protein